MTAFCLIWFNVAAIVLLVELARRDREPIPVGLIAGLSPGALVVAELGPLKALVLMSTLWLCAQSICLWTYHLAASWRSTNRSIWPWVPDPFERACMMRVDRFYRPSVARAAVISTLLAWAAFTITEEELTAAGG